MVRAVGRFRHNSHFPWVGIPVHIVASLGVHFGARMTTPLDSGDFLNQRQLAAFLGISPRSVRNFCARGLLPKIKLGRRTLFRRQSVLRALEELEVGGAAKH